MGKKYGRLITIEGAEGCGKSTHARLLYNYLKRHGYKCILTREPGGTPLNEKIRNILLDPSNRGMNPICEMLLFEASRSVLVEKVILPALSEGYLVICDRYSDSTLVYQGYAGNQDLKTLRLIDRYATRGVRPDLTIVLDIPVKAGLKRARNGATRRKKVFKWDRMERKSLSFHKAVRRGYLALATREKGRIKVIRSQADIGEAQRMIRQTVLRLIRNHKV